MTSKNKIEQKFQDAVAAHRQGRKQEAIANYKAVLAKEPKNHFARHYLGVIYHQSGQLTEALSLLEASTAHLLDNPGCRLNLANLYKDIGQFDKAQKHYIAAQKLNPGMLLIGFNFGQMLELRDDLTEAMLAYGEALSLPEARERLAVLLIEDSRDKALDLLAPRAEEIDTIEARLLGAAISLRTRRNELDRVQAAIERLSELRAENILADVGITLARGGKPTFARMALTEAIRLNPQNARTASALGVVLNELCECTASKRVLEAAITQSGNGHQVFAAYGDALKEFGDLDGAIGALETAIALQPQHFGYRSNLQQLRLCQPNWDASDAFKLSKEYASAVTQYAPRPALEVLRTTTGRTQRLRLGLLSSELGWTPIGRFLAGFLRHFPRNRIELWVYSDRPGTPDALGAEFRKHAHRWIDCGGWSDVKLAQQILAARMDMLLDLAGHAGSNRLPMLSWRLAPKQGSFLGYAGTTGAPELDFRVADALCEPDGADTVSSERILRMPGSYFCFDPAYELPKVGDLPAIRNGFVTFGCFVQRPKISRVTLEMWIAALTAVPDSRMQVRCRSFVDAGARQQMCEQIEQFGGDAGRFDLLGWSSQETFLKSYQDIDIGLNTFPFHQATNFCDALWMGVPTLSLFGHGHQSRMANSLCAAAGIQGWCFADNASLARAASDMTSDLQSLAQLRAGLRSRAEASELADQKGFAMRLSEVLCAA